MLTTHGQDLGAMGDRASDTAALEAMLAGAGGHILSVLFN